MNYLLDTHALIWALENDDKLSITARHIIEDENNTIFVSMASIWEMAIKISLGKLKLSQSLENIMLSLQQHDVLLLSIQAKHILKLLDLPFEHNDPFDRLMIAQCLQEDIAFVSNEALFLRYGVKRIW
ncbi:MAG: type II toxin-antitoxin system VapC family toxin [Methylococcaceae bacterium]